MVIVDTTVWIDYLGGTLNAETEWLDREMPLQRIGLTDMVLCEVLQGIRETREFQRMQDQLLTFEVFSTGGAENAIAPRRTTAPCASEATPSAKLLTAGSPHSVC